MTTLTKSASLEFLGLPDGDHWVKFHVEDKTISFQIAQSVSDKTDRPKKEPIGFVQRWSGTARKLHDEGDSWLSHINKKHLR